MHPKEKGPFDKSGVAEVVQSKGLVKLGVKSAPKGEAGV